MASGREAPAGLPVEARGLVKRYGRILAVDRVDLTVHAGDIYGFLGPNGAGKPTAMRMLILTRSLTRGQILAGRTLATFTYVPAVLAAIAALGILLSVATHNSAAAIVGTLVYELVLRRRRGERGLRRVALHDGHRLRARHDRRDARARAAERRRGGRPERPLPEGRDRASRSSTRSPTACTARSSRR